MKKTQVASGIILNVASIALGVSLLFSSLCQNEQISGLLSQYLFGKGEVETLNTSKPPIRFNTWYNSVEDVLSGNGDVAKATESEGAVLLKNDNKALPLDTSKDKVSLFGVTAYDPAYSLDGAGEVKINKDRQQFLYDELVKNGVSMNEELASWYKEHTEYYRDDVINIYDNKTNKNGVNATLNGANWSVLPDSKASSSANTAIFVTGRMTNEAIDITPSAISGKGLGEKDNNYLKFTDNELSVLAGMKELKASGKINKIIVLLNQANPVVEDLPEVFKNYDVDAAMWIGYPGSDGLAAVSDLLTGKVSPSGGLSTTWFTTKEASSSYAYFGTSSDVLIQEGIYLGYKYAETRYEDRVLGSGNTDNYIYGSEIAYPFGYGLSYADFSMKILSVEEDTKPSKNFDYKGNLLSDDKLRNKGDDLLVKVEVTNTSSTVSAKEIVQLYAQKPYTEANKTNGVEKPSVELVGFGKTKKLAPGEKQVVEIKLDANKYFASYDTTANKYVVDEGTYYLSAARNSHQAINNILKYKLDNGAGSVNSTKMDSEYGSYSVNQVLTYKVDSTYSSNYKYYTNGDNDVTNLFDFADPNKFSDTTNKITYMSRKDWTKTADEAKNQKVTVTSSMKLGAEINAKTSLDAADKYYKDVIDEFPSTYPSYGKNVTNGTAKIQLADMIGVEYQDSRGATAEDKQKWEDFMDQLTYEESAKLTGSGLRKTEAISSIGKPQTTDVNASNAISWKFDMALDGGEGLSKDVGFASYFDPGDRDHNPTGYPCEGIVAATFNTDIAYAVGQAIGEDGLWTGANGLYGFGLGLHRNAYHGRAGEYYSDDPYLAGMMGGYSSLGAQSKGLYVYNKHFILNDQETSRTSYNTWLNEQTMRETYLRPFEIAIEIGDAMNVMNSFNRVGNIWSGASYNLMTKCLRGELGMRGFAITDYYPSGGMTLSYGILAGTDLPDGNGGNDTILKYGPSEGKHPYYARAVRRSAQRILYTVANSNAMNFIGKGTIIINHDPDWYRVRDAITLGVYAFFTLSAAFFVITNGYFVFDYIKRKKSL